MLKFIKKIAQAIKNLFIRLFRPKIKVKLKAHAMQSDSSSFSSAATIRTALPVTAPPIQPLRKISESDSESTSSNISDQDSAQMNARHAKIESACRSHNNMFLNSLLTTNSGSEDKEYAINYICGFVKANFDTLYRYADSIVNLAKVLALSDTRNSYGLQDIAEKMRGSVRVLGITILHNHSFGDYFIGGYCSKIREHRAATPEIKAILSEMQRIFSESEKLYSLDIMHRHEVGVRSKLEKTVQAENVAEDERAAKMAGLY